MKYINQSTKNPVTKKKKKSEEYPMEKWRMKCKFYRLNRDCYGKLDDKTLCYILEVHKHSDFVNWIV